ncbi:ParA family protein [Magnetococcales bacterium HHB-1]
MHVLALYNDKGGVGRTTLTVALADILSTVHKKRVLVIDFDSQNAAAVALLGRQRVDGAMNSNRTLDEVCKKALNIQQPVNIPDLFFLPRPGRSGKSGEALTEIHVLLANPNRLLDTQLDPNWTFILKNFIKPSLVPLFDYVLIDMPSQIRNHHTFVFNALVMSDSILIPVEPHRISLNGLSHTFDNIFRARELNQRALPEIIGLARNKTDPRGAQYKRHFPEIVHAANQGEAPPLMAAVIPQASVLTVATDDTLRPRTLQGRYKGCLDGLKQLTHELDQRAQKQEKEWQV